MNDSGILKDILDKFNDQSSLLYTVLGFTSVNVIIGIINFFGQRNLKRLDVEVNKDNIRETKRLQLFEQLYSKIDSLRHIYNDSQSLTVEIQSTVKFINAHELYLKKKELEIARNSCDYFSTLIVNFSRKDIKKERDFLEDLKKEFIK